MISMCFPGLADGRGVYYCVEGQSDDVCAWWTVMIEFLGQKMLIEFVKRVGLCFAFYYKSDIRWLGVLQPPLQLMYSFKG